MFPCLAYFIHMHLDLTLVFLLMRHSADSLFYLMDKEADVWCKTLTPVTFI